MENAINRIANSLSISHQYRIIYSGLCSVCGRHIYTLTRKTLTCGQQCGRSLKPTIPLIERFWKHVVKKSGCWKWKGSTSRGYGHIYAYKTNNKRKWIEAHRLSWIIHNGKIPKGLYILHKCDNPPCTNPKHLWLGTKQDNNRDTMKKNRNQKGEKHCFAKLTVEEVLAIKESNLRTSELSKIFDISNNTVYDIKNNRTWRSI